MLLACFSHLGPGFNQSGHKDLSASGMGGGVARQGVASRLDRATCKSPGCYSLPEVCGYCQTCYDRMQGQFGGAGGHSSRDPVALPRQKSICKTAGCGDLPIINGYCKDCHDNIVRTTRGGGDFPEGQRCKAPTCRLRATPQRLGYCEQCYEIRYLVGGQEDY